MKHIVKFSGGKDSTAMLLMMLERDMLVNEIIFCDTGCEYPEVYDHIKAVEKYIGRQITVLHPPHTFEYFLIEYFHFKIFRLFYCFSTYIINLYLDINYIVETFIRKN